MAAKYTAEIMAIECPYCHSQPRIRCIGPGGQPKPLTPHGARVKAAKK